MKLEWFVMNRVFREGGRIVAGPYDSAKEAADAMTNIEKGGAGPLVVDAREVTQ